MAILQMPDGSHLVSAIGLQSLMLGEIVIDHVIIRGVRRSGEGGQGSQKCLVGKFIVACETLLAGLCLAA